MKPVIVALGLLVSAGRAHAQPGATPPPSAPAPAPAPSTAFLQQRVVEELAADGIILSRLGVALELEAIGDKLLVSLVDVTTGRASASTKLDAVPLDREAAVASLTQVVANLTAQLRAPAPTTTPLLTTAPPTEGQVAAQIAAQLAAERQRDREERAVRERAEIAFREQAIGFGTEIVVSGNQYGVSVARNWTAHRGDVREPLDGPDFYAAIGRDDLADQYKTRRHIKIGALVGSIVALGATGYFMYEWGEADRVCTLSPDECDNVDADAALTGVLVSGGLSLVGLGVWAYYHTRPHPISESEAKRLGAEHNRALRARLGLPTSMTVAPYASAHGGGLALAGAF